MDISNETKELLKRHRQELQKNDFNGIYKELQGSSTDAIEQYIDLQFIWEECDITFDDIFSHMKEVPDFFYYNNEGLSELQLPDHIEEIGICAFKHCVGLRDELILPKNLKVINAEAFADCREFTHVRIPQSVRLLDSDCFADDYSLKLIEIPKSMVAPNLNEEEIVNMTGIDHNKTQVKFY